MIPLYAIDILKLAREGLVKGGEKSHGVYFRSGLNASYTDISYNFISWHSIFSNFGAYPSSEESSIANTSDVEGRVGRSAKSKMC